MNIKDIENNVKTGYKFKICNICGCKQYSNNYAVHLRTKKHQEVKYANEKFEITKGEPPKRQTKEVFLLS